MKSVVSILTYLLLFPIFGHQSQKSCSSDIDIKIDDVIRAYTQREESVYYKAYADQEYGGKFIEMLDEQLVIDGTNEEYRKIGYRKNDSVNGIDKLSMDNKKIIIRFHCGYIFTAQSRKLS